jgi:diguanylate cyclase (GGDEF)-like protein
VLDECGRLLFDVPKVNSALLMLDIDFFKRLNDTHGHECGDEVLRHFASIVRSQL